MSRLIVDVNELEDMPLLHGSRFRFIGQLLELECFEGTTKIIVGNLPEFRQRGRSKRTLTAVVGSLAYEHIFFRSDTVPQRGDIVSVWLVFYVIGEDKYWEVLNLNNITIPELNKLRLFWESPWGAEFRALSSSPKAGTIGFQNEKS